MTALTVVEDLEVLELEDRVGEFDPSPPAFAVEELDLYPRPDQNDSMTALSKQSPTDPIEGTSPESGARRGG